MKEVLEAEYFCLQTDRAKGRPVCMVDMIGRGGWYKLILLHGSLGSLGSLGIA